MDINKLGLTVGALALLLAIPLAVVANLITPKVRDWYSTTSLKRLRRRISELKSTLEASEKQWTFTPGEWEIYRAAFKRTQASTFGLVALFYIVTAAFFAGIFFYQASGGMVKIRTLPASEKFPLDFMLLFSVVGLSINAIALWFATRRYHRNRYMHTDDGRKYLSSQIDKLSRLVVD